MEVIGILAMVGTIINDVFAILSVIGSSILLLGSFGKAPMKKYGRIADWSLVGLGMGWMFQICMVITHTTPEKIGMIFRMPTLMVYALLSVSLLMLIGRFVIRRMLRNPK